MREGRGILDEEVRSVDEGGGESLEEVDRGETLVEEEERGEIREEEGAASWD